MVWQLIHALIASCMIDSIRLCDEGGGEEPDNSSRLRSAPKAVPEMSEFKVAPPVTASDVCRSRRRWNREPDWRSLSCSNRLLSMIILPYLSRLNRAAPTHITSKTFLKSAKSARYIDPCSRGVAQLNVLSLIHLTGCRHPACNYYC